VGLPFSITIRPDRPLHDQVVLAVTKAIVTRQLQPGDRFPSVRTLSQELKINPNTAQRIIGTLVERGLLEVQSGVGTLVTASRPASASAARAAVHDRIEQLVVEARRLGLDFADLLDLIRREWR
jgi:DNA-binding transcriptional regulator YhcF (GntR family)